MITVFLVDHALENPRSIRKLLPAFGLNDFRVEYAITYHDILEGFCNSTYDVCVIDSTVGDGLKLFSQARSVGCTAPIVLVTSEDAVEAVEAIRSGVSDCLVRSELSADQFERSICYVVEQARGMSLQWERERRYLGLLENGPEMIYTHDLDGNFTSMNRAGEQLIGYSQSEILGLNILQIVVPEYRDAVRKMIEQTVDAQTQTLEEIELLTKSSCRLLVEVGAHPIYHDGKPIEVQGTATIPRELMTFGLGETRGLDIHRQSEARLLTN